MPALADGPLYRLVHDDLSEYWHPVWFAEFAEHAGAPRARLRRRGRPLRPAHRDAARGRRARGLAARRRRPDRVRELQRPADRAPLPPERALPRRRADARSSPRPSAPQRLHWAVRPKAEPLEVGLRRRRVRRARSRAARARVGFDELRDALGADPSALGEALLDGFRRERLIPHAGPLRAASEPGERPTRLAARALAGRARARADVARLHDRAHGGARRAAADHAARRHPRPRRDPRRAAGAHRPRAQPRRTSTTTCVELARLFLLERVAPRTKTPPGPSVPPAVLGPCPHAEDVRRSRLMLRCRVRRAWAPAHRRQRGSDRRSARRSRPRRRPALLARRRAR